MQMQVIISARANAGKNHGLDPEKLTVGGLSNDIQSFLSSAVNT